MEAAAKFMLKMPAVAKALPPGHALFELVAGVVAGDVAVTTSHVTDPSFDVRALVAPLDAHGVNVLHIAALANRPEVIHVLFQAADAATARSSAAAKLATRRDALHVRGGVTAEHAAARQLQLDALDRLMHIASEQQFLELIASADAAGRSVLHYAAAARGVMVDDGIFAWRAARFVRATSSDGHDAPLFPPGGWVSPATGELWWPGGDDVYGGGPPTGYVSVASLLRARTDPAVVDARDVHGATPLIYATVACDVRAIRCLLEHGADGFAATTDGVSALDLASNRVVRAALVPMDTAVQSACGGAAVRAGVKSPLPGITQALSPARTATGTADTTASPARRAAGGTPARRTPGGVAAPATPAAAGGDDADAAAGGGGAGGGTRRGAAETALMLLVNSGEDINGRTGIHLRAPLHTAAIQAAVEVVELLLNNGAKVDIVDVNGCTPAHLAAELGTPMHQEVIHLLAEAGANMNATSSTRKTPLHLAATGGPLADLDRAVKGGSGSSPRGSVTSPRGEPAAAAAAAAAATGAGGAAATGVLDTTLASSVASPRGGGGGGGDGSDAVLRNDDAGASMVALLVHLGGNVEALDAECNTPLLAAAKRGNVATVDTLLSLGARVYAQNIRGHTALHLAAFNHHIPVVRQLARWDAEVGKLKYVLDSSGRSAYDLAADPPTRDALHTLFEACAAGRLDLAQAVARAGAAVPHTALAPWLPVRPFEVTRLLRRTCLHTAVTGAARAMAQMRADKAGTAAAAAAAAPAAHSSGRPARANPSAVHVVAGVGLRFVTAPPAIGATLPPDVRMAWGGSAADVKLKFYEPADADAALAVDVYAYTGPAERAPPAAAAAGGSSASEGSTLAARRTLPGSELTSHMVEKEYGRVVDWLLRAGCDANVADVDGVTPAMLAARYGLHFLLRKLLAGGAAPGATDRRGNNVLHYAYAFRHPVAASIVEETAPEAVVDAKNADGRAPAAVAASGLAILSDTAEKTLVVRRPVPRSSALVITAAA